MFFWLKFKKNRSIQFAATNQSVPKEFFKEQLEELSHQLLHHICFFFGGGAIWTSEIIAKKGGTAAEEPPAELKEETPAEAEANALDVFMEGMEAKAAEPNEDASKKALSCCLLLKNHVPSLF